MRVRLAAAAFIAAAVALPFGGVSHAGCVDDWLSEDQFVPPGAVPMVLFFYGQANGLVTCIV